MKKILLAGVVGIWATAAMAHSPLQITMPAHEATVEVAPAEIVMDFKGQICLTRVTITHADNDALDLDLSGHAGFISDYTVPLQAMGSGSYRIAWRDLAADGHALDGLFGFTVA